MSKAIAITDAEFETEVLQAMQPVLVYFWAGWCGPCRLVSPSVESLSTEYSGLKVVKMEIDPNPDTVKKYQIEAVPALMLFKSGEQVKYYEGAITKPKLISMLENHL